MRCLSLTQPWASLVAISVKTIETRSWGTSYRGPLAIHAAKGFPKDARAIGVGEPFHSALQSAAYPIGLLPLGAVIATCCLVACKLIVAAMSPASPEETARRIFIVPPPEPELSFGDYAPGRYAWMLEDVKPLPVPIPAKGKLGLWEWDGGANARD